MGLTPIWFKGRGGFNKKVRKNVMPILVIDISGWDFPAIEWKDFWVLFGGLTPDSHDPRLPKGKIQQYLCLAAVPAKGAEFVRGKANRTYQIWEFLVFQGGKFEALANPIHHGTIFLRACYDIFFQVFVGLSLEFLDGSSGSEIHFAPGTREIQKFASEDKRRARGSHVHLARSPAV